MKTKLFRIPPSRRRSGEAAASRMQKTAPTARGSSDFRRCMEQVEICSEQARAAARLKRFRAACGLFGTARELCRHAIAIGDSATTDALDRLCQIEDELAAYSELARSMERPIVMHASAPTLVRPQTASSIRTSVAPPRVGLSLV